jgi:hypothetical protein
MTDITAGTQRSMRLYLVVMVLLLVTTFAINIVQALETGGGLGIHDTHILSPQDAKDFNKAPVRAP